MATQLYSIQSTRTMKAEVPLVHVILIVGHVVADPSACNGETSVLSGALSGKIVSPGYEQGSYPESSRCRWLIIPRDGNVC